EIKYIIGNDYNQEIQKVSINGNDQIDYTSSNSNRSLRYDCGSIFATYCIVFYITIYRCPYSTACRNVNRTSYEICCVSTGGGSSFGNNTKSRLGWVVSSADTSPVDDSGY